MAASRRAGVDLVATDLGWWTMSGEALMEMMRRCYNGEDPDLVYAEEYANAEHEEEVSDGDAA
jgi:hypothetical protein